MSLRVFHTDNGLVSGAVNQEYKLIVTEEAKDFLIEKGSSLEFGARPLRRTIQKEIVQPLAMRLLRGEFHDGDHIRVDARNGELVFERSVTGATANVAA